MPTPWATARTLAAAAVVGWTAACDGAIPTGASGSEEDLPPGFVAFTVDQVRMSLVAQRGSYLEFLSENSLSAGMLRRPVGARDDPFRNSRSAAYHVLEGEGLLTARGDTIELSPGHVVFVRGEVEQFIHDISSPLLLLTAFATGTPNFSDPPWAVFTADDVVRSRSPDRMAVDELLQSATLSLGVLTLPRQVGDNPTTSHPHDELLYVVRGGGTMVVGDDFVPVERGSIVFVERGVRHNFTRVWRDLVVLLARTP